MGSHYNSNGTSEGITPQAEPSTALQRMGTDHLPIDPAIVERYLSKSRRSGVTMLANKLKSRRKVFVKDPREGGVIWEPWNFHR